MLSSYPLLTLISRFLYEKGKEMQAKLDKGEAEDQKALAKMFQCSEALVSGALKSGGFTT